MLPRAEHSRRARENAQAGPDSCAILVVDDEESNLKSYRAMLERAGFQVLTFDNPVSALHELRDGARVDAVVTDYRMPGMDGLAFLEALRGDRPSLPVIMLTAHGDIDTYFKSFSLGLFEYINKPFHEAELIRIVRAAVGGPCGMSRNRIRGA